MATRKAIEKIKQFNNILDIKKVCNYTFKKLVFWVALSVSVVFVLYMGYVEEWDFSYKPYAKCPEMPPNSPEYGKPCRNAFYLSDNCREGWCKNEFLNYGVEYGTKPTPLKTHSKTVLYCIFALAFLLNHFLYNRELKFKHFFREDFKKEIDRVGE